MMNVKWRAAAVVVAMAIVVVTAAGCGDDGGPDEAYGCADGTELEVLRSDAPDADGNVAFVRIVDSDGEDVGDGGRVTEDELAEAIAACEAG